MPRPTPAHLTHLLAQLGELGEITARHRIPAREARRAQMPPWAHPLMVDALADAGIPELWSHQREVADLARGGRHCVVSTSTASGKSLGYLLPILTALAEGKATGEGEPEGAPGDGASPAARLPTALYLAPTKALAADQLAKIEAFDVAGVRPATYDGDTPTDQRGWIRRHANLILTNPDMLHRSFLPAHRRWAPFLRGLRYVVVDESHSYTGVFGSHVSLVLRRLRRVAAHYGAHPTFVFASATSTDAAEHASALLGACVTEVSEDGSPRAAAEFVFVEPDPEISALSLAGIVLGRFVQAGAGTIAFARSRAGSEVVASRASDELRTTAPELAGLVAPYRGGYLPEDRRAIEADLRHGRLRGVAATSALELGIDISGLDAVVLAGWPGSRASFTQRAGRAGRTGDESLTVFIASNDPLDTYLVHHPEAVFGSGVEKAVVDPHNPHVLGPHLAAAAYEIPLRSDDATWFGTSLAPLAERLTMAGLLRRRSTGWYWTRPGRPADAIALRGAGEQVRIVEKRTGRVLGTVDEPRAHSAVHTGAVHLHRQEPYVVTELDLASGTASVVKGDPGWSTVARSVSAFDIDAAAETRRGRGGVAVHFGDVTVHTQVVSFERRLPDGTVLGSHPLALPERGLATKAVWWTYEVRPLVDALILAGVDEREVAGAAHAAEHAAIGVMPLIATVDRRDIGGVSVEVHPQTGVPTVMVYDATPGGAGFAERGFKVIAGWLDNTAEAIERCACAHGCPACVQSPSCGSGNEPLHKRGAVALLRHTVAALLAPGNMAGESEDGED